MPNKIKFGTAGGLGFEGTDSAENFDVPANVIRVSYICLGAGGGGGPSGGGDPSGGGGGGGGLSKGSLQVDPFGNIRVRAGGGGQGSTSLGSGSESGTNGQDSFVRTNYGERTGSGGKGGESFNGGNGGNGNVRDGQNGENPALLVPGGIFGGGTTPCRGGGAAGLNSVAGRGSIPGAGGNGVNFVFNTSGFSTTVVNSVGLDGANYGGGGGGSVDAIEIDSGGGDQAPVANQINVSRPGGGGGGIAFVGWVVLTAPKTILRSGEPVTVTYSDSFGNTGTVQTSFTNETEVNVQQEYTYTDNLGAQSKIIFTILPKVKIKSLTASPNPQTSGSDGIPNYDTFLIWEGISVLSAVATRNDSAVSATWEQKEQPTDVTQSPTFWEFGSKSVTNLYQSISTGSSQPGSDTTYTLTATDGFNTATANVTVKAYNDNCPDTISIPDQLGKEPGEEIRISTSPVRGIDMVTSVVCGPGVQVIGSGGSGYTTSTTIISGSSLNIRVYAEPFNTDENGLVNEKTVYLTVGCQTISFKVQTRAPIVQEIFDFGDNQFAFPYPKVDTRVVGEVLPDGGTYRSPTEYLNSPTIVEPSSTGWQVELEKPYGVQIKSKDIKYSPPTTTAYTDISSQNDTNLEVNVQRQGDQPNNNWTKPNII
jgi:hypothetical protein